jgi:hypothetical protein
LRSTSPAPGQVADELVLGGGQRAARRHPHAQRAEQLAAMQHGNGPVRAGDQRQIPARQDRQGRSSQRLPRPGGRAVQLGAERQPYLRRLRASALGEDLRHPAGNFLRRVGITAAATAARARLPRRPASAPAPATVAA